MRRVLLFIGSFLLLVSSLWASRIFLDELEVRPGEWTQLGKDLIAARDETGRTVLSGDGRTLVQAVTRQVGDESGGVVDAGFSLSIYRREGMGWVQAGEPIEGANAGSYINSPYLLDVSHDGSRIAYRERNLFVNDVIRDGNPVSEWNAIWVATDPLAPSRDCIDGGSTCPNVAWQTVGSTEQGGDVIELSITGDDAYSFYLESVAPPDLSLSRSWFIALRMVVPPTAADINGSTSIEVGIDCPSGCEEISGSVALPHNQKEWIGRVIDLRSMTDTQTLSITRPVVIRLPENLNGAVIQISEIKFQGAGNVIRILDHAAEPQKSWSYSSRISESLAAKFSSDGDAIIISGYKVDGSFQQPVGCNAFFSGVNEVFELRSGSLVRKGEPICGSLLGMEFYAAIDAAAETLAVGRFQLAGLYGWAPQVRVYSLMNGSWNEVFVDSGADSFGNYGYTATGSIFPQLSEDGTVLLIGEPAYQLSGSLAGYDSGGGTYLDAAPNAGRIRRFEKSDAGWREMGVPLIGNAGDRLQLGYPQGLSADGSRVVTHTLKVPATPAEGSPAGAGVAGQREIVVFGERIVLPDDMPAVMLPSVSPRQLAEGETPQDTLKQSIKVLQWQNDTWYQAGKDVEVEHATAYVNLDTSISADGQLIAVSQSAQCADPNVCSNPVPPENYLPSSSTYSFTELTDRITLEHLYFELDGAFWRSTTGWLQDDVHCAWFGVLCDANGFVIGLKLSDNRLSGSIPDSLGNFRYLRSLDLSDNTLSGGIPGSIGQLRDLSQLSASNAGLSGVLDASFGQLTQLQTIDLSSNRLSGDVANFADMGELRVLDIADNAFSGNFPSDKVWQVAEYVDLSSNALSGALPSSIGTLQKLTFLNLRGNALSGKLPTSLADMDTLQTINVSSNALSGPISELLGTYLAARESGLAGNAFNCPYPSALIDYFLREGEQCLPPDPPAAPVIVRSDYGDQEIVLVVSVAVDGGAEVSSYDAFCTDGDRVYAGSSETTRIEVTGLTNGVAYTCHVTASNSAGVSAASSKTGALTPEELNDGVPIWLLYKLLLTGRA